jgi:uncharacterized protein
MIIADTSALLALFNRGDHAHTKVVTFLDANDEPLAVPPFVVAELDYLVATRIGVQAELAVLRELAGGAYDLPALDAGDLSVCADLIHKYADQNIGVTDASIAVLAKRYQTTSILTLDHRHFGVLRSIDGAPFTLLP